MKAKGYITIFLWVLSWLTMAQTPNLPFINFNEKEGLPEKYIYNITQDESGLIWIGTGSGLYQFNGKNFTKINSNQDKAGHQINNILQHVYRDYDGKLWLSSLNAIQKYDPKTGEFSSVDYSKPAVNQLLKAQPSGFFRDSNRNLWIATKEFWVLFDEKNNSIKKFSPKGEFITPDSKIINKIIQMPNGQLWALSNNGLFEFNSNGTIIPHFNLENNQPKKNTFFDGYYDAKRNCIWLACGYDGIARFDLTTQKISYNPLINEKSLNANPANYVTLITPKSDNEIWFVSFNLGVYTISNKQFFSFQQSFKDEYSFKTVPVAKLFKDKENNLWIASYNGLSQLPWQNNQIKTIPLFNSAAQYTVEPFGVLDYNGSDLLIANNTSNGLLWWNNQTQKLSVIENPFYKGKHRELKGIQCVARNSKGEIFAASEEHFFSFKNNQLIPLSLRDQKGKSPTNITRIVFDQNDNLYLYSPYNGFYFFDVKNNALKHFNVVDVDAKSASVSSNLIAPRTIDNQNNCWFAMTEGVYCWKKSSGKFLHFATGKAENTQAKIVQSIDVIQDRRGHFWITTLDNGIFELIVNGKHSKLLNYNKENSGLPSDYCSRLILDKKGFLWIGTLNGLTKFDTKTKKVISVLNRQHGLVENGAVVMLNLLPNDNLVVNHYGVLSVINLATYKTNQLQPKVTLTSIKVLDAFLNPKTINEKSIQLKHNENFISFEWASDVLNNANQNRFAYQLSGVDKKWNYTDKNSISYSNLDDGDYEFKVKSVNNDGVWGEVTTFQISIATPFWKAWWFYGLLVLLVGGILYALYQFKLNQVKKEESIKSSYAQQIAEIEMKALRAQMNPHFIFNSLNSIQKYILKNDSFAASQYLTKFSKLIRLILDHSNQNYILLSSEAELLKLYIEIEALRFDNQFEYELVVDDSLNTETIQIPSMIIQPYVENAIWHGLLHKETKGKLTLHITRFDENNIKVLVTDDGIGRQKAQELKSKQVLKKKSYGLQITEDRISILNKTQSNKTTLKIHDLKDGNNNALGTQIELIIPVQTLNE